MNGSCHGLASWAPETVQDRTGQDRTVSEAHDASPCREPMSRAHVTVIIIIIVIIIIVIIVIIIVILIIIVIIVIEVVPPPTRSY